MGNGNVKMTSSTEVETADMEVETITPRQTQPLSTYYLPTHSKTVRVNLVSNSSPCSSSPEHKTVSTSLVSSSSKTLPRTSSRPLLPGPEPLDRNGRKFDNLTTTAGTSPTGSTLRNGAIQANVTSSNPCSSSGTSLDQNKTLSTNLVSSSSKPLPPIFSRKLRPGPEPLDGNGQKLTDLTMNVGTSSTGSKPRNGQIKADLTSGSRCSSRGTSLGRNKTVSTHLVSGSSKRLPPILSRPLRPGPEPLDGNGQLRDLTMNAGTSSTGSKPRNGKNKADLTSSSPCVSRGTSLDRYKTVSTSLVSSSSTTLPGTLSRLFCPEPEPLDENGRKFNDLTMNAGTSSIATTRRSGPRKETTKSFYSSTYSDDDGSSAKTKSPRNEINESFATASIPLSGKYSGILRSTDNTRNSKFNGGRTTSFVTYRSNATDIPQSRKGSLDFPPSYSLSSLTLRSETDADRSQSGVNKNGLSIQSVFRRPSQETDSDFAHDSSTCSSLSLVEEPCKEMDDLEEYRPVWAEPVINSIYSENVEEPFTEMDDFDKYRPVCAEPEIYSIYSENSDLDANGIRDTENQFAKNLAFITSFLKDTKQKDVKLDRLQILKLVDYYKDSDILGCCIRVEFIGERGIDAGGLTKDAFNMFWKEAYISFFKGEDAVVPSLPVHKRHEAESIYIALGRILCHMLSLIGSLPHKLCRSGLLSFLFPGQKVDEELLLNDFFLHISLSERLLLNQCLKSCSWEALDKENLLDFFSAHEMSVTPTPKNLKSSILTMAYSELLDKPFYLYTIMRRGFSDFYMDNFFSIITPQDLVKFMGTFAPTSDQIISSIHVDEVLRPEQETALYYLKKFIREMTQQHLETFLSFVTGSPTSPEGGIKITFNRSKGLSRCPTAHTCSNLLELPTTYLSYQDFKREFNNILSNDESFRMTVI